jgi:hypothetical protein
MTTLNTYKKLFILIVKKAPSKKVQLDDYIALFDAISKTVEGRGKIAGIKFIKSLRLIIYRHLAGDPLTNTPMIRIDKLRLLPTIFGTRINEEIVAKDRDVIRNILTLLQMSYVIKTNLDPDVTNVIQTSTASTYRINSISEWAGNEINSIFPIKEFTGWKEPHSTTSAGPMGPAVYTAPYELSLLPDDLISDLKNLGGHEFTEWFDSCYNCRSLLEDINRENSKNSPITIKRKQFRRLVAIPAPEGKTRVIAILDYWSQTVLKPLHDWSFDHLKNIVSDMTFRQNGVIEHLADKNSYHSFDLSAATDRFPIDLQEKIVALFIGCERAKSWRNILVNYEYTTDWDCAKLKYGAGQPMGAYSSWSIFSLCHHIVIRYCAALSGHKRPCEFTDYAVLGDDVVIADPEVARHYSAVISDLGVEISFNKSLISKDTFEFAKRIFYKNTEFTAFPLAAMYENRRDIAALWSTTLVARERDFGWLFPQAIPRLLAKFQKTLGCHKRQSTQILLCFESLACLADSSNNKEDLEWALTALQQSINYPRRCSDTYESLKDPIGSFIASSVLAYKLRLLRRSVDKFSSIVDLMCQIGIDQIIMSLPPDAADSGDDPPLPIDVMKIPILWIISKEIAQQNEDINKLKMFSSSKGPMRSVAGFELLRTIKVSPASDLSRVISRQTNLRASAQVAAFVKFLRSQQSLKSKEYSDALSEVTLDPLTNTLMRTE